MTSNLTDEGRNRGRALGNRKQADQAVTSYWDLLGDIHRHRAEGETLRQIAAGLNACGLTTRKGTPWSAVQVKRLLDRSEGTLEFVIQKRAASGWYDWRGGFNTYAAAAAELTKLDREQYRIEVYSTA